MRRYAKESLIYTAIFCLGYLMACGGGSTIMSGSPGGGIAPTGTIPQMMSSDLRPIALVQSSTNARSVMAAFLSGASFSARSKASINNPSPVGQSYESDCAPTGAKGVGIHSAFGNSGLLSMTYAYAYWAPCSDLEWLTSVGGDENGNPQGYPIVLDGTINTLVMYGTFVSGKRFECTDTTDTSPLSDGSFVRAYYDLAHDAVILGSGTIQLSPTCSISVPSGDDVIEIHVQWLKS